MKYVKFGSTGLTVSQFCLGAWHLPGTGVKDRFGVEEVDKETFAKVVGKAYDLGINFIDGANRYHGRMSTADLDHVGNSEKLLGQVLKGYPRESLVVATKVRGPMAPFPNGQGLSRKHIMWQIGESLRRLELDYVDLYQIHWEDELTPKIETLRALNNLVDRGLVRYIGESNHNPAGVVEFMELAQRYGMEGFASMQEPYNLLERQKESETLPVAKKYGMAVMAYVPIAQGVLSGKYLGGTEKGSRATYIAQMASQYFTPEVNAAVSSLVAIAGEKGCTLPQLALAWMLHKQEQLGITIVPILGITKISHLEDNVGALDVKLSGDEMKRLEEMAATAKMGPASY
ncbi:MAG: aldo/keto reductase [Nitrososphaerota archaeon]|nr:aldo/keto reductase [Nitrososphaerota archaeon]